MDPVSKMMLSFNMVLIIVLALEFKGGESGFFFSKVSIFINNRIPDQRLGVHCKDKTHDIGYKILPFGGNYSFKLRPDPFLKVTLYFCKFYWFQTEHYFDIYKQERDEPDCDTACYWQIFKTGPCKIKPTSRECFTWNEQLLRDNQLAQRNNITLRV
ncbi:hypothetical protein VNO77_35348 [Canavalia gladiata]|uniref:S-protein homolog n=1 Tax=Canavalia gladiata TaxID=3824 RepID=A0AAN9KG04_CANGL